MDGGGLGGSGTWIDLLASTINHAIHQPRPPNHRATPHRVSNTFVQEGAQQTIQKPAGLGKNYMVGSKPPG